MMDSDPSFVLAGVRNWDNYVVTSEGDNFYFQGKHFIISVKGAFLQRMTSYNFFRLVKLNFSYLHTAILLLCPFLECPLSEVSQCTLYVILRYNYYYGLQYSIMD